MSCENDSTGQDPSSDNSTFVSSKSVVKDSNDKALGTLLIGGSSSIVFLTSEDYVVSMGWNAEIFESTIVFKSEDCSGDAYVYFQKSDNKSIKNKLIKNNNKLYEYADADENNLVDLSEVTVQTLNSMLNIETNVCESFSANYKLVELKRTTNKSVGLPETIAPPISIE